MDGKLGITPSLPYLIRFTGLSLAPRYVVEITQRKWWARLDLNQRPLPCEGSAFYGI